MSGNWSTTHAKITHTQSVPCILMLVHNLLPLSLVVVKDSLIVSLFVSVSTMTRDIHGWIFMPPADNRMRGGSMFSTCPAVCACVCVCVCVCVWRWTDKQQDVCMRLTRALERWTVSASCRDTRQSSACWDLCVWWGSARRRSAGTPGSAVPPGSGFLSPASCHNNIRSALQSSREIAKLDHNSKMEHYHLHICHIVSYWHVFYIPWDKNNIALGLDKKNDMHNKIHSAALPKHTLDNNTNPNTHTQTPLGVTQNVIFSNHCAT